MNENLAPHVRHHLRDLREHIRLLLEWSRQSTLDASPEFLAELHIASHALAQAERAIPNHKEKP